MGRHRRHHRILKGVGVGFGCQVSSSCGLLCGGVVGDQSAIGMSDKAAGGVDCWGPVSISVSISLPLAQVVVGIGSVSMGSVDTSSIDTGSVESVALDSVLR